MALTDGAPIDDIALAGHIESSAHAPIRVEPGQVTVEHDADVHILYEQFHPKPRSSMIHHCAKHPHLLDMQVNVRLLCGRFGASITLHITHTWPARAKVIEDHPHYAAMRAFSSLP